MAYEEGCLNSGARLGTSLSKGGVGTEITFPGVRIGKGRKKSQSAPRTKQLRVVGEGRFSFHAGNIRLNRSGLRGGNWVRYTRKRVPY